MESITEFEASEIRMYRWEWEREREGIIDGLKLLSLATYVFFFASIAAIGITTYQEHRDRTCAKKENEVFTSALLEAEFSRYDTTSLGNEPFSKRLEMRQAFMNGQMPKEPLYNSSETLCNLVTEGKTARKNIERRLAVKEHQFYSTDDQSRTTNKP